MKMAAARIARNALSQKRERGRKYARMIAPTKSAMANT
jgi:hypothetical protein